MSPRQKALRILTSLISKTSTHSYPKKPGALIDALSFEERDVLKNLKSDDVKNLRIR